MAIESPGWANQAGTYGAEQTRRAVFSSVFAAGTKQWTDYAITAHAGMAINVGTGEALVKGTSTSSQGYYYAYNAASISGLSVAASDPTNPRIDAVVLTIDDSQYLGVVDDAKVQVLTGTPSPGANLTNLTGAPSVPTSSLLLAYILVPAGSTSVSSGNIAQQTSQFQSISGPPAQSVALAPHSVAAGASTTTSAMTIPYPGLWLVFFNILVVPSGSNCVGSVQVQQNGSNIAGGSARTNFIASLSGTVANTIPVQCNAGDQLALYYGNGNGSGSITFASGAPSNFNGFTATWLQP